MPKHLWEVEANVISRDLRGKYVMLYGKPKSGKTTAACAFPGAILFAFERGYNAIGNAYPYDITKWADYKFALRDLEDARRMGYKRLRIFHGVAVIPLARKSSKVA